MYSELVPVIYEVFKDKGFVKNEDFLFAKQETMCEIVYSEMSDALSIFPLAMTYIDEKPKLIALFSVIPEQNCFVTPDGRWKGFYIPHAIKNYPFITYPHPQKPSEQLLCIEKSALVPASDKRAQELFTSDGEPNEFLQKFIRVWNNFSQERAITDAAMKQLVEADLFVEWEMIIQDSNDQKQRIGGLYRIDEERLRNLSAETLANLNQTGALGIAYAQILSYKKINTLKALVANRMQYIAEKEKIALKISEADKSDQGSLDWGF